MTEHVSAVFEDEDIARLEQLRVAHEAALGLKLGVVEGSLFELVKQTLVLSLILDHQSRGELVSLLLRQNLRREELLIVEDHHQVWDLALLFRCKFEIIESNGLYHALNTHLTVSLDQMQETLLIFDPVVDD